MLPFPLFMSAWDLFLCRYSPTGLTHTQILVSWDLY